MNPYQVWTGLHTLEIGANLRSLGRWALVAVVVAFLVREYWVVSAVRGRRD